MNPEDVRAYARRNWRAAEMRKREQKPEEGPYLGTSPEMPGLFVQRASPEEVVGLAPDIARDLIEVMLETGEPLPPGLRPLSVPNRIALVVPA